MSGGRLKTDLRITAGTLRGRRVPLPRGEVRPTSERARQAFFNIAGDRVRGARFLDLFAGSGIFSFEALSRGASSAVAVDSSRENLLAITRLAASFSVEVETVLTDAVRAFSPALAGEKVAGGRMRGPFDLVYADPPYDFARYDDLLKGLAKIELSTDALVAVEHRRHTAPFTVEPRELAFWRRAEYGEVWITFFTASGLQ